jgi:hypothetical protein
MVKVGFDCYSKCPVGWQDSGLFCRNSEYGRGRGYAWQMQDGFNNKGQLTRCEADNGKGNC